ncbi:sensor histidine kinase [Streptomyces sp. NPDC059785]|uniref:sensor histidine kinase n=1 Tax=Streptomyces sp. NPDC059785 TaxID=3346945 RepID=UPI003669C9E3
MTGAVRARARTVLLARGALAVCLAVCGLLLVQAGTALMAYGAGAACAMLLGAERRYQGRGREGTSVKVRTTVCSPAVLAERVRLRDELHDGLGPALAGIGLCVRALSELLGERGLDAERALLDRMRTEVHGAVAEVRRLIEGLPPAAVEPSGLVEALHRQALLVSPRTDVEIAVSGLPVLTPELEAAAHRIVAEALTNVVRHAGARHARVALAGRGGSLLISVADDGCGMPPGPAAGIGIASMRRRAEALGGSLTLRSAPGHGTAVLATLPLAPDGPDGLDGPDGAS